MSDFVKGSITVRTRRNYVVVEADYEEKRFKREFRLSLNTNFDGLKTAMSNEGILTITAPKKVGKKLIFGLFDSLLLLCVEKIFPRF